MSELRPIGDWWYSGEKDRNVEEFKVLWDWADFWQTVQERGVGGWLRHRHRYSVGQGCFPVPNPISRLHDMVSTICGFAFLGAFVYFIGIPAIQAIS